MFPILDRVFLLQCAYCERRMTEGRYLDGAFYCFECARGEHRRAGWGSKAP